MRHVKTISICLEPEYVKILEDLARAKGSKSAAVRDLLMEHVYREYYSDPENVKADREETDAWLSIASWPQEDYYRRRRGVRKKRSSR